MLLTLSGKVAKYELKLTLSIEKKEKRKKWHYCGVEAIWNTPTKLSTPQINEINV